MAEVCISGAILMVVMLITMDQFSSTSRNMGELEENVEINYRSVRLLDRITADVRVASAVEAGTATVQTTSEVFPAFSVSANGKLGLVLRQLDFSSGVAVNGGGARYHVRYYLEEAEERGVDVDGRRVTTYSLKRSSDQPSAPAQPETLADNVLEFVACRVKSCPSRLHLKLVMRNITKNRQGKVRLAYTSKLETVVKTRGLTDTNL